MKIVWDETKRALNIEKHGLDFESLTFDFFISAVTVPAKKGRYKAIGKLGDGTIAAIFVSLGSEALSVISMRPARKDERRLVE